MKQIPTREEDQKVHSKFQEKFEFIPSPYFKDWPSILEPMPSFTISLTESAYGIYPDESIICKYLTESFMQLRGSDKIYYSLTWFHRGYKEVDINNDNIRIYPDGDYAIFLNKDMTLGVFGHPWENTICIFGEALIEITRKNLPKEFSKVLREIDPFKKKFHSSSSISLAMESSEEEYKHKFRIKGIK